MTPRPCPRLSGRAVEATSLNAAQRSPQRRLHPGASVNPTRALHDRAARATAATAPSIER